MEKVYLDNAATTPMDPKVIEAMLPYMKDHFGNPSSIHSFGRKTKTIIEQSRKQIAGFLNAKPKEIFFTSGGTEADNLAICSSVCDLGVKRIITSRIEHKAVGMTAEKMESTAEVKVVYVDILENGHVDLEHLETLLKSDSDKKTLVTLMHANNEIGNKLDLEKCSALCKNYGALFHSDTVQTMAHYEFNLSKLDIDFITGSAHKFHGPKGVGFLYINEKHSISPLILGGGQERMVRGGTENLYGIVGLAKAMELAYSNIRGHQEHIQGLKSYMIQQLRNRIQDVDFNGDIEPKKSLYTVLNTCFPKIEYSDMFLFRLDLEGIAVSGGSACSSGSNKGSHVLSVLGCSEKCLAVRFSFSRFTTKQDIDFAISKIEALIPVTAE